MSSYKRSFGELAMDNKVTRYPFKDNQVFSSRIMLGYWTILPALIFIGGRYAEVNLELDNLAWISKLPIIEDRVAAYNRVNSNSAFYYLASIPIFVIGFFFTLYMLVSRYDPSLDFVMESEWWMRHKIVRVIFFSCFIFGGLWYMFFDRFDVIESQLSFVFLPPIYIFFCVGFLYLVPIGLFLTYLTLKDVLQSKELQ